MIEMVREGLILLTSPGFLGSDKGLDFIGLMRKEFTAVGQKIAANLGYQLEAEEVVNLVLVRLLENNGKIADLASCASDPVRYIGACLTSNRYRPGWVAEECGQRAVGIDSLVNIASFVVEASDVLTGLSEVIEKTGRIITGYTPCRVKSDVPVLVDFFARNPICRQGYEKQEQIAGLELCEFMSFRQVRAVANICWGTRPSQKETSLMAALLQDEDFVPVSSSTHFRALLAYKKIMFDEEVLIGLDTDFKVVEKV